MAELKIRIVGSNLPGATFEAHSRVHVGIQRGREVVGLVAGDAPRAQFDLTVDALPTPDGGFDFRGPFVHGERGDRFIYLSWGAGDETAGLRMFRRAKLRPADAPPDDLRRAVESGTVLEAHLPLTDRRGGPVCASVRPPAVEWRLGTPPA